MSIHLQREGGKLNFGGKRFGTPGQEGEEGIYSVNAAKREKGSVAGVMRREEEMGKNKRGMFACVS